MKKALINSDEPGRICEVHQTGFPVAPGMTWVDCADDVTPETHRYNDGAVEVIPTHIPSKRERITALEAQVTPRMLREAVVGSSRPDPRYGGKTAAQVVADIDAQIEAIRAS